VSPGFLVNLKHPTTSLLFVALQHLASLDQGCQVERKGATTLSDLSLADRYQPTMRIFLLQRRTVELKTVTLPVLDHQVFRLCAFHVDLSDVQSPSDLKILAR
jgi:hypothetical protein